MLANRARHSPSWFLDSHCANHVLHKRCFFSKPLVMHTHPKDGSIGRVEVIIGPMFSGKTSELLRRLRRHTVANLTTQVIKWENDKRYSVERMSTHDRQTREAKPATALLPLVDGLKSVDCIGIDDGQFFPGVTCDTRTALFSFLTPLVADLVPFCEKMANQGKVVIVAALDGTYQRKPFGDVLNLVPRAERVDKLAAVCTFCHDDAPFSLRLTNDKQLEVIGGADKYTAVCRSCYAKHS